MQKDMYKIVQTKLLGCMWGLQDTNGDTEMFLTSGLPSMTGQDTAGIEIHIKWAAIRIHGLSQNHITIPCWN